MASAAARGTPASRAEARHAPNITTPPSLPHLNKAGGGGVSGPALAAVPLPRPLPNEAVPPVRVRAGYHRAMSNGAVRQDATWEPTGPGVLRLPSGRLVRGRALREPMPSGHPPRFGVYLLGSAPPEVGWTSRWVRWPDFWLPADRPYAREVLIEALERSGGERVEIACGGGRGRTGTALACLAVLDGVAPDEAVAFVRRGYARRAVETPWQRRFVERFG